MAASDDLGSRIALRTDLYLIGDTIGPDGPPLAALGVRRRRVDRARHRDRAGAGAGLARLRRAARERRVRGGRRGRRSRRRPQSRRRRVASAPWRPDLPRLPGVRRVADRLRLRSDPPDEPDPRRPDRRAGPTASAYSTTCRGSPPPTPPRTTWPPCTTPALIEAVMAAGADPTRPRPQPAGSAPTTTRPSRGCTRPPATSSARASRPPARCGPATSTTPPTSPAACTTRCPTGPAASASTTTWPWRSGGCSTTAPSEVAYVDVDVHHGDGVEQIFYDDPRVLTISLHETGQMLFPGTGFPADSGGPDALGSAVNVALPPGHRRRRLAARLPRRGAAAASASSRPTCWSPSRAATATATTRWPTSRSASTASARATSRCTTWPTRRPTGAGWPSAAAATPSSTWSRAPGPTCSPWSRAARSTSDLATPEGVARARCSGRLGVRAPSRMTDGRTPGLPRLVRGLRPGHLARPGGAGHPGRGVPLERPRSADVRRLRRMWRKRTRRSLTGHFGESLAHWPHLALYFSSDRTCGPQRGSCGTCDRKCGAPCPRTFPETSPT